MYASEAAFHSPPILQVAGMTMMLLLPLFMMIQVKWLAHHIAFVDKKGSGWAGMAVIGDPNQKPKENKTKEKRPTQSSSCHCRHRISVKGMPALQRKTAQTTFQARATQRASQTTKTAVVGLECGKLCDENCRILGNNFSAFSPALTSFPVLERERRKTQTTTQTNLVFVFVLWFVLVFFFFFFLADAAGCFEV